MNKLFYVKKSYDLLKKPMLSQNVYFLALAVFSLSLLFTPPLCARSSNQFKILASDGVSYDRFGHCVSISGDQLVVGTSGNGDNSSESASAYVYEKVGDTWTNERKIITSDGDVNGFGGAVSISEEDIAIGAMLGENNGLPTGAVYVTSTDFVSNTTEVLKSAPQLFQNVPNPFTSITNITFTLSAPGEALLSIADVDGRTIRQIKGNYFEGENSITLTDLPTKGVFYYTLKTSGYAITRKMVKID